MNRFEELDRIVSEMYDSLPKVPTKIKINKEWLDLQINNGVIRKEDYKEYSMNTFAGIRVELTEDVDTYEVIYQ